MGKGAARLQEEDYRRRSGGTGRRTRRARMRRMPAPARARMAWTACPACADASRAGAGPGRASPGRNITPGHHPSPQGLRPDGPRTAGVGETYMARRSFDTESHDPLGSAVGKDSDEALHLTIQICRSQGSNLATAYKKESDASRSPRAITVPRHCVLVSCVCELGLSCINQPTSSYCFSKLASVRQESIIGQLY